MGGAALIGVGLGLQAYGTYQGLRAASESAKYQAQIDRNNQEIKIKRIESVRTVGAQLIKDLESDAIQVQAGQITAFASEGIDISSAVVGERLEETVRTAGSDIITAQHNIENAVWGIEVDIMNDKAQELFNMARGRTAEKFAPIAAGAGLLTGLGQLALLARTPKTPEPKSPLTRTKTKGSGKGAGIDPFGEGFGFGF